ncbi:Rha family transcriptional regulator [Acinetobacter bohemicus]|uniref:Phage regulatory protein, rha family n=1 Tax=Acinetobacter bohemicus TaxID=1435036 RepID=A0A1I6UCJ0_9GAMM|nr:Rha family transcriptional regulator [Acinetobacter bohemicus]KAB0653150.1 Rha family transcriptional regulator [Acinetobacter bohemicus]SFS99199.1 phage regulatory protein, rha family [Acinetobacter bohemicus]
MNMMTTLNLRAMVSSDDGEPKTTSYAVAEAFGKRHSDVLRAIKNMKCSLQFRERNFAFTLKNKQIGNTKRNTGFYRMTERGFMFLVMGFNGEKADAIKEAFINAFEWMANQLTQKFQSKWARYNNIVGYRNNRKQQVSCSARDMNVWKHEKHPLDNEIAQLERDLQPSLPYMSGI